MIIDTIIQQCYSLDQTVFVVVVKYEMFFNALKLFLLVDQYVIAGSLKDLQSKNRL